MPLLAENVLKHLDFVEHVRRMDAFLRVAKLHDFQLVLNGFHQILITAFIPSPASKFSQHTPFEILSFGIFSFGKDLGYSLNFRQITLATAHAKITIQIQHFVLKDPLIQQLGLPMLPILRFQLSFFQRFENETAFLR